VTSNTGDSDNVIHFIHKSHSDHYDNGRWAKFRIWPIVYYTWSCIASESFTLLCPQDFIRSMILHHTCYYVTRSSYFQWHKDSFYWQFSWLSWAQIHLMCLKIMCSAHLIDSFWQLVHTILMFFHWRTSRDFTCCIAWSSNSNYWFVDLLFYWNQ
jgi:hypothetical protein